MSERLSEYTTRRNRLETLKASWVIPYANRYDKSHSCKELIDIWATQVSDADYLMEHWASQQYSTAWRMMSFRTMWKLSFATLRDSTWDIQICFVKGKCSLHTWNEVVDELDLLDSDPINSYKFAEKFLDIWDFVWVKGELFITKHGELTIFIDEYQLLSKALRPLWDKWHGIKDEEKIYRQRYLDMTMNEESYQRFRFKSKFYAALRNFYVAQWFEEIETSVLWNAASGAAARPFETYHHDYDLDVYLRIAFEPALKMATVWRYEKVFEIGKDFRNEGSDPSHVQEFTQVEHYAARRNYEDNMKFAENMFDYLFKTLDLPKILQVKDKQWDLKDVNWNTPWERIDYIQWVKKASWWLDITQYVNSDEDQRRLVADIKELWHSWDWMEQQWVTTLIDYLYKKVLRPNIVGPAFVYNYPKTMQPLARQSDDNPNIVEQFQVVVNWWEIIKAYSELVDPTIQQDNFDEQSEALAKWDDEATSGDQEFVLAMEHGMPCQSWFGMWLERILALLTQQDNLRDVIMFPLMKPHDWEWVSTGKDTKTKLAVVILNSSVDMQPWQEMNTVAHLNAAFWARNGKWLLYQDEILTYDSHAIKLNIQHAIMIKQDSDDWVRKLLDQAEEEWLHIACFTKEMLETTDDAKIIEITWLKRSEEIEYLWILIYGNKKVVERLTVDSALYKWNNKDTEDSPVAPQEGSDSKQPTKDKVLQLVDTYLTDTKRHCEQVAWVMKYFASKLWEDQDYWWTVWYLHDIDRDHISKDADKHLKDEFEMIMSQIWASDTLKDDIKSHGEWLTWVPVDSLVRKYLASVDELSWFIYAYSLLRPTWFEGMEYKWVKKRIKDKAFAKGVDREHLLNCEKYLEIPLQEFVGEVVQAMESL